MSPKNKNLAWLHPLVRDWFITKFVTPTEPQKQGWPHILQKKATLISAPTGSGKTFAAFMVCINQLVEKALKNTLKSETDVLYISPLKALSNDIHINLTQPLKEIADLAKKQNLPMQEIRVAVRTGDTPTRDRQAMLKNPPHILVTTPESIYILLTAEKSRTMLQNVKTVIVDEIHAMANSKRGTHLVLSLERLEALTQKPPVRIGLSATQKPIEIVGQFLTGNGRPPAEIVNIGHTRQIELSIESPKSELGPVAANETWDEIYDRITELVKQNRSTLIFVNTRRLAERVAHHLTERIGEEFVTAHHGSLSRKIRLNAETRLKNGELKALVATASLELGIDIGSVDLVCQIGSTRAIAVALQRIGRSGHSHGAISKGKIFVTTRDELLECAALVSAIQQGDLDKLIIPHEPLDILSQQIVATVATGEWRENDLFKLVKKAYPYAQLTRETFNSIIEMLAEGIAGSRSRYGAYLFRDQINGMVKPRRNCRLSAITSGGAIPETGLFAVISEPDEVMVGTLDEDFAIDSHRGDIILLGTTSWRIQRVESARGRVLVEDAHGASPTVPFWRGEAPARTKELSLQVANLRQKVSELLNDDNKKPQAVSWLIENCGLDNNGADQIVDYILQGRAILGAVPTQTTVIAERFFDESGGMQLIIHAPFGSRINKAWGLALRKKFCRSFNFELQAAATEDGLNIALTEQHSFPLADVFKFLSAKTIKDVLVQAVLQSPLFTTRWRWDATRSLALLRFRNGKKIPPNIQRMLSDDLLAAVFPDAAACQDNLAGKDVELPDHPLINETMKDALTEALDLEGLINVLNNIASGKIKCLAVDTPIPSPFSHEILNANPYAFLDDAPLEERRARAVEMRRILPENMLREVGQLDPNAIKEVQQQVWPDLRNEDELHDFLQTVIALPVNKAITTWQPYFEKLIKEGRARIIHHANQPFWIAMEKLPQLENNFHEAILPMLKGWLAHLGPTSAPELADMLGLDIKEVDQTLLRLESTGLILRGHFRYNNPEDIEWCERRLLARIHRLTLGTLRKEIQPVTPKQFIQWLLTWQNLSPGSQLSGEHGLLETIKKLQGFEIPANAWEPHILAKRLKDYDPSTLDRLCLAGVIGWGRLSPHPTEENNKRIIPTSTAPITFFVREESQWMGIQTLPSADEDLKRLSATAKQIYQYLKDKGASFFVDIVKGTDRLRSEIETGLWELVTAGLITADGFDNLRGLIDKRRRLRKKRHGRMVTRHNFGGRWTLLPLMSHANPAEQLEAVCWMLLKRYGVVFRDLVAREKIIPRWRELLITFRRLEDRGEIRGGRFVSGFLGEQFALPYAVESLRAMRKQELSQETITFSAVDPLNLVGIILPGPRILAVSGNKVTL